MKLEPGEHIREDVLERYSMGRVPEEEAAGLEEHVLVCPECQDRLESIDDFIVAFREAASRPLPRKVSAWRRWWDAGVWKPALAAAAAAAALAIAYLPRTSFPEPGAETVVLRSARGADATGAAVARSGGRLVLNIDLTALEPREAYRVEVVDGRGGEVWSSTSRVRDGALAVDLGRPLPAGRYWVRLYSPESPGELLREFGLSVQ
jgi:hypothetical protein